MPEGAFEIISRQDSHLIKEFGCLGSWPVKILKEGQGICMPDFGHVHHGSSKIRVPDLMVAIVLSR